MKKILIMVLLFNSFLELKAQVKGLQTSTQKAQRSLTMFYGNLSDQSEKKAIFLDGKQISSTELLSINSKFIDTYTVDKKPITNDGKEYNEQLHIKTKNNYRSKRISLKDIKKKYSKDQNLECMYFIDGRLVEIDYLTAFLDENNILEICCHLFNVTEKLKLNIIEIFTQSDKNLIETDISIIRQ